MALETGLGGQLSKLPTCKHNYLFADEVLGMNTNSFWKAGHTPTLFAAFLYFDLSFMVWYLLGPMAVQIATDLQLTTQQRGFMVATPILAGALLRFFMGMLADQLSPKTAGIFGQVVVIGALLAAWQLGIHSYEQALLLGVFLGMAGASFAVALPLASQWYPAEHQGKAMGIAGAGNSGTVIAALAAPVLATAFGWNNVFGLALIPLLLTLIAFALMARNAPNRSKAKSMADYFKALGDRDSWWFMFFYSVTFGGFIGLASALPGYFHDQYGLSPVTAGYYTAACVFGGSLMRPLGGALADRFGGIRTLLGMYAVASICIAAVGFHLSSSVAALALFVSAMLGLGAGNGAVFQLVPQRFRKEIGVMTGLIGMAGGIGGFLLAAGLGAIKQNTGDYQIGLWLFASLGLIAWFGLHGVKNRWRTTWGSAALTAARV
ncbi:MAG: nitrate/nitrite transporter [Pseudoalteromonas distincta]|jgi:NNP family nitrate/nitrite transporter-like MFS transporter|nr:nitrate transporter [Halopseudomonas aestusnigri]GMQ53675.1 nitrate/nitrite transporter [Halopseudomonas aestusnigri]|tara:strand:- start:2549 stop:3850 length:1302 start_codon:yes stop_codon:yes gene_type:complete